MKWLVFTVIKKTRSERLTCKDITTYREKNEQYGFKINIGSKLTRFELGDWVWEHMRKERFPEQWRSKLMSWGDDPFSNHREY